MSVNRFYTPSIPQYTSQFVEEKMPWQERSAFEDLKMKRADMAAAKEEQTGNTLAAATQPGYRTQNIAPEVNKKYKGMLEAFQKKHGNTTYSIPALRELTRIQGEFKADPNVSLIREDREANKFYDHMRTQSNYDPRTDPNVDPETGNPRQFQPGQQFDQYQNPIWRSDYDSVINREYAQLKPSKTPLSAATRTIFDPASGQYISQVRQGHDEMVDDEDLKTVRENTAKRLLEGEDQESQYFRATFQGDLTKENIEKTLQEGYEAKFKVPKRTESWSFIPGTSRSSNPNTDKEPVVPKTYQAPQEAVARRSNGVDEKGSGELTFWDRINTAYEVGVEEKYDNPDYFKAISKDGVLNPESLAQMADIDIGGINVPAFEYGAGINPRVQQQQFFFQSLRNDYNNTIAVFDGAFEKYPEGPDGKQKWNADHKIIDDKGELKKDPDSSWFRFNDLRHEYKNFVKEYETKISGDKIDEEYFANDVSNQFLKNVVFDTGGINTSRNVPERFKTWESFSGIATNDYTNEEKLWLTKQAKAFNNSTKANGGQADVEDINDKERQMLYAIYGGNTNADGIFLAETANVPSAMRGQRVVLMYDGSKKARKQEPPTQLKPEEFKKFMKKGEGIIIDGKVTDETNTWGSGMYRMTIGGSSFLVEGDKAMVEKGRFNHNAWSTEFLHNSGVGNDFIINGFNLGQDGEMNFDITDQWNIDEADANISGMSSQIIYDAASRGYFFVMHSSSALSDPKNNDLHSEYNGQKELEDGTDNPDYNPKGYEKVFLGSKDDMDVTKMKNRVGILFLTKQKNYYEAEQQKLKDALARNEELTNDEKGYLESINTYMDQLQNDLNGLYKLETLRDEVDLNTHLGGTYKGYLN